MDPNEMLKSEDEVLFLKVEFIDRIKSTLIDSVVVILLLFLSYFIIDALGIESNLVKGILFILIFLYEPIFVTWSRTLGQRIMKLKVNRQNKYLHENEQVNIGIVASIIRYIVKVLLGWISLLTIHSDHFGRAIHDRVVNSVMTNY